jgi:hypothetical protein
MRGVESPSRQQFLGADSRDGWLVLWELWRGEERAPLDGPPAVPMRPPRVDVYFLEGEDAPGRPPARGASSACTGTAR